MDTVALLEVTPADPADPGGADETSPPASVAPAPMSSTETAARQARLSAIMARMSLAQRAPMVTSSRPASAPRSRVYSTLSVSQKHRAETLVTGVREENAARRMRANEVLNNQREMISALRDKATTVQMNLFVQIYPMIF